MAEKTIKTRIGLKIDTLANWSTSTLILKKGEVAFATAAANTGTGLTEPVIIMKIGDGTKTFSQLADSFYAKSSDVLAVCKNKDDLDTYVKGLITANIKDTNTKIKSGEVTFDDNATVEFRGGNYTYVTPNKTDNTVTIEIDSNLLSSDMLDILATSKTYVTTSDFTTFKTKEYTPFKTDATERLSSLEGQIGGLTGAMHFVGVSTTDPKGKTGATVAGHTAWAAGDVVLYGNKEYVLKTAANEAANWVELGDEGSYVLKTTTVNGKALSSNITLSADDVEADAKGTAQSLIESLRAADLGALTAIDTTKDGGLKVTNNNKIDIDDAVTFVLDCGGAE